MRSLRSGREIGCERSCGRSKAERFHETLYRGNIRFPDPCGGTWGGEIGAVAVTLVHHPVEDWRQARASSSAFSIVISHADGIFFFRIGVQIEEAAIGIRFPSAHSAVVQIAVDHPGIAGSSDSMHSSLKPPSNNLNGSPCL